MTMECKHKNISRSGEIGFDIQEEGEERQFLETCKDCGQMRFVSYFIAFDPGIRPEPEFKGKWKPRDTFPPFYV